MSTGSAALRTHRPVTHDGDLDDDAENFVALRPRLMGIAYRILGSWSEAEDIVQDTWLRWQSYDRSTVRNPTAFLVTTTTRLAINAAQTARARRESYVGRWLPEPVDTRDDPALGAERADALELGVLLLLQRLSPTERAAYVLRQAFDYPYAQIAAMLQLSEVNARQLVSRASRHIAEGRGHPATRDEQQRLMHAFVAAAQLGDVAALEDLLAEGVVSLSDGGGVVRAARFPVVGRRRVAVFVARISPRFWPGHVVRWIEANGHTAAVVVHEGRDVAMVTVAASEHGVDQILRLVNPGKLAGLATTPWRPDALCPAR